MKDSSADAGDTGWIPSPGKPVTTTEPVLSSPGAATGEVSAMRRVHTTTREEPPSSHDDRGAHTARETQHSPK